MYRPRQQAVSRRQAVIFTKTIYAISHKEGMTASQAAGKLNGYKTSHRKCSCCYVPTPCRSSRVKDLLADDMKREGSTTFLGEEVDDFMVEDPTRESRKRYVDTTVSLLDIAKPAKRKGPAKDFEIVPKVLDVITWEDDFEDDFSTISFEEWEEIYNDKDDLVKKTYSAVLRGDTGG